MYDYEATREDELTFAEGEAIEIVNRNDDGWFEGIIGGTRRGLFPGRKSKTACHSHDGHSFYRSQPHSCFSKQATTCKRMTKLTLRKILPRPFTQKDTRVCIVPFGKAIHIAQETAFQLEQLHKNRKKGMIIAMAPAPWLASSEE